MIFNEFLQFLLAGGIAALVNFFSRIILNQYFSFSTSIIIAYILGMITAFLLMRFFVFKSSSTSFQKSSTYFLVVNLLALLQTWLISLFLFYAILPKLDIFFYSKEISHAIGVLFPVITSYYGHKYLSFRR